MRRPLTLCRAGLPLAAAVVLLTACGGDDGDGGTADATSSAETSSSAEETSASEEAPEAGSDFCTAATALNEQLDSAVSGGGDPASVEDSLRTASEGIRAIEPPAEISDDWNTLADGLDELGAAYTELDEADPESVSAFQQRVAELQGELTGASANVETYLTEQCGIDTGSSESSSATTG
jgi:hypothetical protein